jgi:predicted lactoylglutathione lyase
MIKRRPVMLFTQCEIILYVIDQQKSSSFYAALFDMEPFLNVPGMTEFLLTDTVKLGLMPENGIAKILLDRTPHPSTGKGIPRCELYLHTDRVEELFQRAIQLGAKEISGIQERDWGNTVGYVTDMDGHVLAFAHRL